MASTKVISLLPRKNSGLMGRVTSAFSFDTPVFVSRPEVVLSNGTMTCVHGEAWNTHVPVDPALALQILTRDLPPVGSIEMCLLPAAGYVDVKITAADFKDERRFNMSTARTGWGNIEVSNDRQNRGIGRRLMRNEIEFAHALGIKTFLILAGSSSGGYAWRAMGIKPTNMNSFDFDQYARQRAVKRYDAVKAVLNTDERKTVEPLLELSNDRQMEALIELDMNLSPRLNEIFNQASVRTREQQATITPITKNFSERAKEGKKITVGQVLLAGTSWEGQLDLEDPVQMRRVGEYVGGWKYIGFK
jgi:hypothetical protein